MDDIYKMELHNTKLINGTTLVIRVAGGWIYHISNPDQGTDVAVFVSFNNEFQKESK